MLWITCLGHVTTRTQARSRVLTSADLPLRFARGHHAAEERIAATGLETTMVRPNGFMQNTLVWSAQLSDGVVHEPVPDAHRSIVDVRDVAAVAVAALLAPGRPTSATYEVTGPEPSSPRGQAHVLSELLRRPVELRRVPITDAVEAMRAQGWPQWSAEGMGELLQLYTDGGATQVTNAVQQVTGRPARS